MPSIDITVLEKLEDDYKNYSTFVETGTYYGQTISSMIPYFQELHTIEIGRDLYNQTKNKYNHPKVYFYLGDSSVVLTDVLKKVSQDTIFFLDAHWSSGDTSKGDKDVPLLEELQEINTNFKNKGILIIGDYNLFGKGPNKLLDQYCAEDFTDISLDKILSIFNRRINKYYFIDSYTRLIVHINSV